LVDYLIPSSASRLASDGGGAQDPCAFVVTGGRSSQPWGCTRCGQKNFKKLTTAIWKNMEEVNQLSLRSYLGPSCSHCNAMMPFICELCQTGFTRKANLNKHKKRTHKEMIG